VTLRAIVAAAWLAFASAPLATGGPHHDSAQRSDQAAWRDRLANHASDRFTAPPQGEDQALAVDLARIFDDPALARALMAVRVDRLRDGRTLFALNADRLIVPASNLKILTVATAAARLGWQYRFETRLETTGHVAAGTLHGDLVVTSNGDPSVTSPDGGHAALFLEWADVLRRAGIMAIDGRVIGDDDAVEDDGLGAGWAWDYLAAGYAAPAGALNYNDNSATLRLIAGPTIGAPATLVVGPPGHGLQIRSQVTTASAGSTAAIELERFPGRPTLTVRGTIPLSPTPVVRSASVDNPTVFVAEAVRLALASRGIPVSGGAWDIDDAAASAATGRRVRATHRSPPLSILAGHAMKDSQNQWAEVLLKTVGRTERAAASSLLGRRMVLDTIGGWGVPTDSVVMYDGSGLSRYNYATASALVAVLTRMWADDRLRGPFVASLPVGGRDGSLELRMKDGRLAGNVRAKTGTLSHVRALSGYLTTASGDTLVFSMIANHYTVANAAVDAIVERALGRLIGGSPS
jgi:D-alanyl-D-alanine carboxypeptidase/D-alanyl-D-alanine-endopeptidase (penicillin-binding protein 4)